MDNQETKKSSIFSLENVTKLQNFGYRLLLLGTSVNSFVSTFSIQHIFVYSILIGLHGLTATYELIVTFFFCDNMLDMVKHFYTSIYLYTFHTQWMYLVINAKKQLNEDIHIEDFYCTKTVPEFSERIWSKNIKVAAIVMSFISFGWALNSSSYAFSPLFELVVTYFNTNEVITVYIFPSVFQLPKWAKILTYIPNSFTILFLWLFCTGSYVVMGVRVLKIKTICQILIESLKRNDGDASIIKNYVEDHIKIIKFAKILNHQLSVINNIMFSDIYFQLAIELFSLSVATPDGAHYYLIAADVLSIFSMLSLQCWMGSTITDSLQSIAQGAYNSQWFDKGKRYALDLGFMIQMAQKPYIEKIWMGSLNVERSTILSLVRSSYAAYTLLMILQQKKVEESSLAG